MSDLGLLVVATAVGAAGVLLLVSVRLQPAPPLERAVAHLRRAGDDTQPGARLVDGRSRVGRAWWADTPQGRRLLSPGMSLVRRHPRLAPTTAELAVVGRTIDRHVGLMCVCAVAGLVIPPAVVTSLQLAGVLGLGWFVPVVAALFGAVVAPLALHSATIERADVIRTDLRYQISAYLDVVAMLLAGNTGYEGALEQAAMAGDGRLFAELRRAMRDAGARGASLTTALTAVATELGLDELERVAAAAALSAAEGAPVARTLSAKCSTMRAALATEQETEARLRTSRLTSPIVGMALIFMALVIFPALTFST